MWGAGFYLKTHVWLTFRFFILCFEFPVSSHFTLCRSHLVLWRSSASICCCLFLTMATSAATTQQQRCIARLDEHVKVWLTAPSALGFYLKAKKRNPTNRLCRLQLFPVQTASAERRGFEDFCGCRVWNMATFTSCFHTRHMPICSGKHLIAVASANPVL